MASMKPGKLRPVGRLRKSNKHLPKYMILEHGGFYYRGPATEWKRFNLGRTYAEALEKYADFFRERELATMADVLDRYQQLVIPHKAQRTQLDNNFQLKAIRRVFGKMDPKRIQPVHCYAFRDKLGIKSPTQANLHLALLKHVFSKAIEWGACPVNPARDVRKLPLQPRDRYVEDWEFEVVYNVAPERVKVAMDLAVLTGLRRGDILALQRSQLREDGILVKTSKTKRKLLIEWSDELRSVVGRAKRIKPEVRQHLIATRDGKPYTPSGFSTVWQRAMNEAMKKGLEERFSFNDLRAKSATDDELMAGFERLGHSSPAVTQRVYRRKPAKVKPLR